MTIFNRQEHQQKHYRQDPQDFSPKDSSTKVVVLGSGNPFPNPHRMGPSFAVIANGMPYFVDAGEGIWRSIGRAVTHHPAVLESVMTLDQLRYLFLTHLHGDHTIGLPSFLLSPYKFNAPHAKEIYGPLGTTNLVEHVLKAYEVDIDAAWTRSGHNPAGWRANPHEFNESGIIFEDENVQVEAFRTQHAPLDNCWAYRFTTADRVVVLGGDGRYNKGLVQAVQGADLYLADVVSEENLKHAPWGGELEDKVDAIKKYHLLPRDLIRIQKETGVKRVVMIHEQSFMPDEDYYREGLADEVRRLGIDFELFSSIDCDIY